MRFLSLTMSLAMLATTGLEAQKTRKSDLVEPMVDAANSRFFYFSSATRPFGMVNLSPDMNLKGVWNTGYKYNEDTIRTFSHVHCWELSAIPVLPTTGRFKGHLGTDVYGSTYSHATEIAKPGYHRITLDTYGVTAELTSTTRVGFHRYTYPANDSSHVLFDFTTVLGSSGTKDASVKKVSDRAIEGWVTMEPTVRRPKPVTVYFTAVFDKPFTRFGGWKDGKQIPALSSIDGPKTGVYAGFKTAKGEVRMMKVAISYVSVEEAKRNLATELPHWDFYRVKEESAKEWDQWLDRIDVEGGTLTEQRRFYTDLFKSLQGRRIMSDVSGTYIDNTGTAPRRRQIPLDAQGKPKFRMYNSDSFWGAQWSLNTLWHLVYPEVTEEFINSMLMMYDDGGLIPRGPSGGNYTYVMTGAATTPFITSAYMKGIRGFDIAKAYEGMRKNHMPGGMMSKAGYEHTTFKGGGIEEYMQLGYIPYPLYPIKYGYHQDGSALTLEYAYQDFALAQMAKQLGKMDDYALFSKRAQNYRNIFNHEIGWMWVRDRSGKWAQPFDILQYEHGWNEGNAAQYSWWVPHDVPGLIELHGGNDAFAAKLDRSFREARHHGFVSGISENPVDREMKRRVYINYGNQPCMQTPFLFNYAGKPWMTQALTREIIDSVYSGISPQKGYSGDEDQGLMGSLAVLLKIGLFSTDGGTSEKPFYELTSPIFDRITLQLNPKYYPGGRFVIDVTGNSPANKYIRTATLNGRRLDGPFFPHEELAKGGTLKLTLSAKPNTDWGNAASGITGRVRNITDHGAIADGVHNNAHAIQSAIDAASAAGGGKVIIPAGRFLSGPINLKSNVELHLVRGAHLIGSPHRKDYGDAYPLSLIKGKGIKNFSITGQGIIDGMGRELAADIIQLLKDGVMQDPDWRVKRPTESQRANVINLKDCSGFTLRGVTMKDASAWTCKLDDCRDLVIDSVRIDAVAYWNNDGIDLDNCVNAKITNCVINAADDAICLKSGSAKGLCDNILIENNTTRSSASAFKMGTASAGGFRNITVRGLRVYDTYRSAIALEAVDGGIIENIDISDVRGINTGNAVFIKLGKRNKDDRFSLVNNVRIRDVKVEIPASKPDAGYEMEGPVLKYPPGIVPPSDRIVSISPSNHSTKETNVILYPHNIIPASITGLPGHPVKNVTLEDIEITYAGGGRKEKAFMPIDSLHIITEAADRYPEFSMFGELPVWGLYLRHAEGITMKNVRFTLKQYDYRPSIAADDIRGLTIDGLKVTGSGVTPSLHLKDTEQVSINNPELPGGKKAGIRYR
jgi:predicted alpha-1,2-mannosidase